MSIEARITNVRELEKLLPGVADGVRGVAIEAAEDMVFEADRLAKLRASGRDERPHLRTGRYLNSIHPVVKKSTTQMTGAIRSNVEYARYLEEGTRPHIIRPKTAKALFWPGARHPVKQVNHPGTPAYRVLGDARDAVLKRVREFLKTAWDRWVRRGGRGR